MRGRPKGSKNKPKCSDVDKLTRLASETIEAREKNDPAFKKCLELEQNIGKLIGYYLDGERAGYLISYTAITAKVKPIAAYKGVSPHTVSIPVRHITIL